ncbi:hypothetical protein NEMBOFW57_002509 [Staphylotrichum longicolle]|uniref:Uncharacterized protein n=1 Tax=Staphylotrichum longicolle TaxID=669026 RepID=A0AAD4HYR6_9PEZI|nr:hypothetical protein NEMBOFW57_002509 [Staphylotrichum longicolle]
MHPASTLADVPSNNSDDPRHVSLLPALSPRNRDASDPAAENHVLPPDGTSPPARKDTNSSVSTAATDATSLTVVTADTPGSPYSSVTSSPTFAAHAVFSARDGTNVGPQRRPSRRRTGPLTAVQRDRAHLIRKMDMELDASPSHQHAHSTLGETRIRTPLPSGPRPDKHVNMPPLPGFDSFRADLQGSADRILASPFRSRYANVSVLLVRWQADEDSGGQTAFNDLAKTFREDYNYVVQKASIPVSTEESKRPWLWLSQLVADFVADHNQRDCLNIFYYSGFSYLDRNREAVLASSKHADPASVIRWTGIQQCFENARSDALLLMDCAYYPSYTTVRQEGMLELIAASAGDDHVDRLGRSVFTRALIDELRMRAIQPFREPFSAAELHSKLLSAYSRMIPEREPAKEVMTSLKSQLRIDESTIAYLMAPVGWRPEKATVDV